MSDIDTLKQITMKYFVTPLSEFRTNTKALDETHTRYLNQFQNIIGSLFAPGVDFSGKAADAIAELVGQYLQAANSLSDAKEGLSTKLADASRDCETTAAAIRHDLSILPDADPTQSAGSAFAVVVFGEKLPLPVQVLIVTGLAAAATTYIIISGEQQNILDDMSRLEEQWETDILNDAMAG